MSNKSSSDTSTRKGISGRSQLLLAGLLALAVAASALTLYGMAARPAAPAASVGTETCNLACQYVIQQQKLDMDEAAVAAGPATQHGADVVTETCNLACQYIIQQQKLDMDEAAVAAGLATQHGEVAGQETCNLACQYVIQQQKLDMCEGLCDR